MNRPLLRAPRTNGTRPTQIGVAALALTLLCAGLAVLGIVAAGPASARGDWGTNQPVSVTTAGAPVSGSWVTPSSVHASADGSAVAYRATFSQWAVHHLGSDLVTSLPTEVTWLSGDGNTAITPDNGAGAHIWDVSGAQAQEFPAPSPFAMGACPYAIHQCRDVQVDDAYSIWARQECPQACNLVLGRRSDGSHTTIASGGTQGVGLFAVAPDGSYVVFASDAPGLVPADTDSTNDYFVYDVATGTTQVLPCAGAAFISPIHVSGNSRFVSFDCSSSSSDSAFLWDRSTDQVSPAPADGPVSNDGRHVLASTTDLHEPLAPLLHDLTWGTAEAQYLDSTGRPAWIGTPIGISANGGATLFIGKPRGGTSNPQVYLHDRRVESVSQDLAGGESLTTDGEGDGATVDDVVETRVTTPVAGSVEIEEAPPAVTAPNGQRALGQQVAVVAPGASAVHPVELAIDVTSGQLAGGYDVGDVGLAVDGGLAPACPEVGTVTGTCLVEPPSLQSGAIHLVVRSADPAQVYAPVHTVDPFVQVAPGGSQRVLAGASATDPTHFSGDGRFVFVTADLDPSAPVVPSDTNQNPDGFVLDRATGHTERVTVAADGSQLPRGGRISVVSRDGRYVGFHTCSVVLPGVTPPGLCGGVGYVRDRATGGVRLATADESGTPMSSARMVSMTGDGRYVVVTSSDPMVTGSTRTPNTPYCAVRDLVQETTESCGSFVTGSASDPVWIKALSPSGRFALVADGGYCRDDGCIPAATRVIDRTDGGSTLVVEAPVSSQAGLAISDDGNVVLAMQFRDTNGPVSARLLRYDLAGGTTERVDVTDDEEPAPGDVEVARMSSDGRFVSLISTSGLTESDTNQTHNVFLRDTSLGRTYLVDATTTGAPTSKGLDESTLGMSADGASIAFGSQAPGLVSGPEPAGLIDDVYLRTRSDTVSTDVGIGGTASTGSVVSASDPVATSVTTPVAGPVTISEHPLTPLTAGYSLVGQQVDIEAPAATAANPLSLTFTIDRSMIPPDSDSLVFLRNQEPIAPCADTSGRASPDPCIAELIDEPVSPIVATILSSHASVWTVGLADKIAPTAMAMPSPTPFTAGRSFGVAYSATENGSGVDTVRTQLSRTGVSGAPSAWKAWGTATSDLTHARTYVGADTGSTYCFRARSTDRAGNQQASWSDASCTAVPLDDEAFTPSAGWTRKKTPAAYLGDYLTTTRRGATLTYAVKAPAALGLVVTRCAACGSIQVTFRGKRIGSFSLTQAQTERQSLLQLAGLKTQRTGKLVVTVASANKQVMIEGLGLLRS